MTTVNRRNFISLASVASAATFAGCASNRSCAEGTCCPAFKPLFGVCCGLDQVQSLKEAGYDFWENGVASALIPDKDGAKWAEQKAKILNAALPMRSCNGFLPGSMRLTGPKADFAPALAYAEKACARADEVGLTTIVFGSGGARNVPAAFGPGVKDRPDVEGGRDQFADFCGQLARRIAGCKVTVVIEPLRPNESNIINYVWQGLQVVDEVNSPRLQQLADIFHMIMGRESACSIKLAGDRLKHCHIAAKTTRQYPGSGDNACFKPYFDALKAIGYRGGISCECGWPKDPAERQAARVKALEMMKGLCA